MTCIQCGKCMKACEAGAITQNPKTGVYMINRSCAPPAASAWKLAL
jgi:ferredoxin